MDWEDYRDLISYVLKCVENPLERFQVVYIRWAMKREHGVLAELQLLSNR